MKAWRWVLLLVLVAALAAFGWNWIAADPGYVLVRIRGWRIEATLVTTIVLLVVFWVLAIVAWRLLRWPFGAVTRRHRALSRRRLGEGLVALAEGRHGEAERALARAARHAPQRAPAWLAAAEAASARGDTPRALEALDQATQVAPQAARTLRARILRRAGRADEALALLAPEADAGRLPPAGWFELVEAALAAGDLQRARDALEPLRRSGALEAQAHAELEGRVLAAALAAAPDAESVNALWSKLPKAQRRAPAVIAAYARRVARAGQPLAAMDEVESALRRQWTPQLVTVYGTLEGPDIEGRLRRAEGWLDAHPGDADLLGTLGRMCVRLQLWGKAHDYLTRSIALRDTPEAWEALAEAYAGKGDAELARRCYRNALRVTRGEGAEPLPGHHAITDALLPVQREERDQHGMPRLPR